MFLTLTLLGISIVLFYLFLIWNFNYWAKRGITSPKPQPFFGNYPRSYQGTRYMIFDLDELYRTYKDKEDFVGIFNTRAPQLLILNSELCQQILNENFKHFQDNEFSTMVDKQSDAISGNNPFALTGDEWKNCRSFIKNGLEGETVKAAYCAIRGACKKMRLKIEDHIKISPNHRIDVKDLCLYFTSEVVTDCVFGFNICGQASTQLVFNAIFNLLHGRVYLHLYFFLVNLLPSIKKFYKTRIFSKRSTVLFEKLMQTAIDLRKSDKSTSRYDFLSYLLNLQKRQHISTLEMTTHSMNFIFHGFLTMYIVLAHCFLLLAKYPDAQERLRNEIQQRIDKNENMNFDVINGLPFLEACIYETIRLLPPGFYATKVCTEQILLPNKSGRSIKLKKGEVVLLPLYSIMNDEHFYAKPSEFRPERFIGPSGCLIDDFQKRGIYYGFGVGPRKCVGKRFALAQLKAGLVEVISNFRIRVDPKTIERVEFDPKVFSIRLSEEIWLDFDAIS